MNNKKFMAYLIVFIVLAGGITFFLVPLIFRPPTIYIKNAFRTTWDTTKTTLGSSASNEIKLPLVSSGEYNFTVKWGDGSNDSITSWDQAETTHAYALKGIYTISIKGKIIGWVFNNTGDKYKLLEIHEWNDLRLGNSGSYFYGCSYLKITTRDLLNLTGTTNLNRAFGGCQILKDVKRINAWDTSQVTSMEGMFWGANAFNDYIGGWNVSKVENMTRMFENAFDFNRDISGWDVSSVKRMDRLFVGADDFNQDIGNWDVSSVTTMEGMFISTDNFNQDISNWTVSSVTTMMTMFSSAKVFNQNISRWDVSSVTTMRNMFAYASSFDQDLGSWDVSSVGAMNDMFLNVTLSTQNYDSLLIGWESQSLQSGVLFNGGNSQCSAGAATAARANIVSTHGWTITDGDGVFS